jgi:hypothetical protein
MPQAYQIRDSHHRVVIVADVTLTHRALLPALLFAVWTLVVWGSRVHLIWADEDLVVTGQVWRTALALSFVGFGAATVVAWVRARAGRGWSWAHRLVQVFVVWTIAVWLVRGTQILLDDHALGFVLVHAALASVSIGLALWAVLAVRGGRRPDGSVTPSAS